MAEILAVEICNLGDGGVSWELKRDHDQVNLAVILQQLGAGEELATVHARRVDGSVHEWSQHSGSACAG